MDLVYIYALIVKEAIALIWTIAFLCFQYENIH